MNNQTISGNSHIAEPTVGAIEIGWIWHPHDRSISKHIYVFDDSEHKEHGGWGKIIFKGTIAELIENLKEWRGVTA